MKNRNSNASSDSTDIDLDEIAKMIDPLDDLEENLFSSKPRASIVRNAKILSPNKDLLNEEKSIARNDTEEMEVLTSLSSSNGQTNAQPKDNTLGAWLMNHEVKKVQETTNRGKVNATARARRRTAKFGVNGDDLSVTDEPNNDKEQASSNLKTGLWRGDDLWRLDEDTEKANSPTPTKSPLRSPVRLSIDSGAIGSNIKGQTGNKGSLVTGGRKPGKFDWLGLIDEDSDDGKGLSIINRGKVDSLELTSSDMKDAVQSQKGASQFNVAKSDSFNGGLQSSGHDHPHVGKDFSRELGNSEISANVIEPQASSHKGSISESFNLGVTRGILKSSEPEKFDISEGVVFEDIEVVVTDKDASEVKRIIGGGKEKEIDLDDDLAKCKSTVERGRFELTGKRKGLGLERQHERSAVSRRGNLSEENEGTSMHGYAPTFLGGSSEGSGRRRRRRENTQATPIRGGLSTNFDPLGLFSIDDKDEKDDIMKEKKPLPDWLTGATRKSSGNQEKDSNLSRDEPLTEIRKEEKSLVNMESRKEIPNVKSLNVVSNLTEENTSKLLTNLKEPFEKVITNSNGKPSHNVEDPSDTTYEKDKKVGYQKNVQRHDEIGFNQGEVSQRNENSAERKMDRPVKKIVHEDTDKQSASQLSDKSASEDVDKNGLLGKENVLKSEGKKSERTDAIIEELKERLGGERENKQVFKKLLLRVKAHHRNRKNKITDEDADDSSVGAKNDVRTGSSKQLAFMERRYVRKVRELEEQVGHVEYLEEELAKMRYLEGEVEHLKAVIHVLELEKSATESLVDSLQERHAEQLRRLEEVHKSEVETLKRALLREEKRGAEEVRRLAGDHRKALDRLMEANTRLEEEFRNRMQEARRDWGRDVEAMRQAYQQSNNTAITNASLAVLTGHGFGIAETKDKSEGSKKDDSSVKSISQCPEEVKELNQTVERVETILIQTLEAVMSKAKSPNNENSLSDAEDKGQGGSQIGIIRKLRKPVRVKKRVVYKDRQLGKSITKKDKEILQQANEKNTINEEYVDDTIESDTSQKVGIVVSSSCGVENVRNWPPKDRTEHNKMEKCLNDACQCCSRCRGCIRHRSSRSLSPDDSHKNRDKCDKDGRNMHFRDCSKEYSSEDRERDQKSFAWADRRDRKNTSQMNDRTWELKRHERDSLFSLSGNRLLNGNFIPSSYQSKQSAVIINPKEYLMQLAAGNISNLFQPSGIPSI